VASIAGQKREGRIGLIGGTGGGHLDLGGAAPEPVETPWGEAMVTRGSLQGQEVFSVLRHGREHSVPPHKVNYRANIAALAQLGVERIFAINACGGLSERVCPGDVVIVDQFLDFTKCRPLTFFDGDGDPVIHVDLTEPYCPSLRRRLRDATAATKMNLHSTGTYVACEGPRYESAAEIRMYRTLGGDVIGMTGVPELVLAREIGLCYSALCLITNNAAGIGEAARLRHSDVESVMERCSEMVAWIVGEAIARSGDDPACEHCGAE
jgi:5'-methylthioadenosine phosphorylase